MVLGDPDILVYIHIYIYRERCVYVCTRAARGLHCMLMSKEGIRALVKKLFLSTYGILMKRREKEGGLLKTMYVTSSHCSTSLATMKVRKSRNKIPVAKTINKKGKKASAVC